MKKCNKCKKYKNLKEFYKSKTGKDGVLAICKKCARLKSLNWHYNNKEASAKRRRKVGMSSFGLTVEEYDKLFIEQNGNCKICGNPETVIDKRTGKFRRLAVDHDHKTGKVRGLLCQKHNTMIGLAEDSIEILEAAKNYIIDNSTKDIDISIE